MSHHITIQLVAQVVMLKQRVANWKIKVKANHDSSGVTTSHGVSRSEQRSKIPRDRQVEAIIEMSEDHKSLW